MHMRKIEPVELNKSYLLLNHGPVTLVSSAHDGRRNVMAVSWAMPLDFDPPKVAVVVDGRSFTRELIEGSGEFVLSIPTKAISDKVLAVGSQSGREMDKFAAYAVGTSPATKVLAPLIDGCVAWLECKVITELHNQKRYDLFIAEVVAAWADPVVFNNGRWSFETDAERTIHYIAGGSFFATGKGFEVQTESKVSYLPTFSPAAKKLWNKIPKETQKLLQNNVWCGECSDQTTIVDFAGRVVSGCLLLEGKCSQCGGDVSRYLEN